MDDIQDTLIGLARRLFACSDNRTLAATLAEALTCELQISGAQVWLRSGELESGQSDGARYADDFQLAAGRADGADSSLPARVTLRDSLAGFAATEGVLYEWKSASHTSVDWVDCEWAKHAGYVWGLAVPLRAHNRAIGALTLWGKNDDPPIPDGLARLLGEHVSLAFEQTRRLQSMKRQVRWLTSLQQVIGLLAGRLSLPETYRLIFEQVSQILALSGFSINLYDEDRGQIERVLVVEKHDNHFLTRAQETREPIAGTVWERVLAAREAILINRLVVPEPRPPGADEPAVQRSPGAARSLMLAPMMLGDHVIGVISAESDQPSAYDQETLDLLSAVANQAALAVENARLLQRLNRQVIETQKANELKSQFVANISHEVRTPLNAIIGFTRIVQRHGGAELDPQQVENLTHVLESAQYLLRIINDLLDLSRLEAGRLTLQPEEVDLYPLIAQLADELAPLMEGTARQLVLELPEGPVTVITDPVRVRQVLVNLISNALKFGEGGAVTIRAGRPSTPLPETPEWRVLGRPKRWIRPTNAPTPVRSKEEAPPARDLFFIEVSDQGPGLSPAMVEDMFEGFFQAGAADPHRQVGTGLGLVIVHRIADLLGGSVWVKSQPGEGSTFRVILAEMKSDSTAQ